MINQPNTLVTTEWLFPLLKEQLEALHSALKNEPEPTKIADIAAQYHEISGVLKVGNLPVFATFSEMIEAILTAISLGTLPAIYVQKAIYASDLLLHELTNYVKTGLRHYQLLNNRQNYLYRLLTSHDALEGLNQQLVAGITASQNIDEVASTDNNNIVPLSNSLNKSEATLAHRSNINLTGIADDIELPAHREQALTPEHQKILQAAWRYTIQKLLENNQNDEQLLKQLETVSDYLLADALAINNQRMARLWYLTVAWLQSLALNKRPAPQIYAYLLSQLDNLIILKDEYLTGLRAGKQSNAYLDNALFVNDYLIDIYIQLTELDTVSTNAQSILEDIKGKLTADRVFFPSLLTKLEQLIFKLPIVSPSYLIQPLEQLRSQLIERGWQRFESQITQILDDLQSAMQSDEIYAQLQWQIERQMQDLYAVMYAAHQTIDTEIGQHDSGLIGAAETSVTTLFADNDSDTLELPDTSDNDADNVLNELDTQKVRQSRIAVEAIKHAFNDFLYQHDSQSLSVPTQFDVLITAFSDMGLIEAKQLVSRIATLFDKITDANLTYITWDITDAITEALAALELFMDYLAQQTLDDKLVTRIEKRLSVAEPALDALLADSSILQTSLADMDSLVADNSVTRYDDSGEHGENKEQLGLEEQTETATVESDGIDTENVVQPVMTTSVESEALIEARLQLKDDNFDMDEDIREIFIEEAEEVLETLDTYLPQWQQEPQNLEPLGEIRRGFHTLKGSGRMVGAFNVGEMAWSVENLLNRVLDKTLPVTDELITFITDTKDLIPVLVEDFANQRSPSIDPAITVLKALNLQKNRDINTGLPSADIDSQVDSQEITTPKDDVIEPVAAMGVESQTDEEDTSANVVAMPEVLLPFLADVEIPDDIQETDEDIKEIFIEEAQEVLEDIEPAYQKWQQSLDDKDLLTEMRRGFHTLKGSGRMVGAESSAAVAWAVENMLNRVLDNTIEPSAGLQALVGDVIAAYPQMVSAFEQGNTDYPEQMALWIACANAYSKKLGDKFDYKKLIESQIGDSSQRKRTAQSEREDGSSLESDRAKTTTDSEKREGNTLKKLTAANDKLIEASLPLSHINDEGNSEFKHIFIEEAYELIEKIEDFVDQHKGKSSIEVSDDITRAFHTLRGAAATQNLDEVKNVSATIESSLEQLQQKDVPMGADHLQVIAQSVHLIKQYVDQFTNTVTNNKTQSDTGDNTVNPEDVAALKALFDISKLEDSSQEPTFNVTDIISDDIDDLLEAEWELEAQLSQKDTSIVALYAEILVIQCDLLLERVRESDKFTAVVSALKAVYQAIAKTPSIAQNDMVITALLAGQEQLTHLFDAVAASLNLTVDVKVLAQLAAIAQPDYVSNKAKNKPALPPSVPLEIEEIETDPELLEIFLEEAQEIDADIIHSFTKWRENPEDLKALAVLQRHLHTIKGGARMAGVSSIGDLTHEAETIYEYFVEGKIQPTAAWASLMQEVQDTLSQQIDYVVNNGKSFYANDLVTQLKELSKNKAIPDGFKLNTPVVSGDTAATEPAEVEQEVGRQQDELSLVDDFGAEFQRFKENSWQGQNPDPDILEVFLDEAQALVDSSQENIDAFQSNTGNIAALQALQRELHTIKGGARMVYANGIADIAHEMETVYESLASRRRPATKMVSQLLVQAHNWMSEAIYLLQFGINPPEPAGLIQALRGFIKSPDRLTQLPEDSLESYLDTIKKYEEWQRSSKGLQDISEPPPIDGGFVTPEEQTTLSNEMIRVSSGLMEQMINLSGESAINRARIDMNMSSLENTIDEMGMTVQRLSDQLRRMDIELEAQILSQIDESDLLDEGFDPLEMDQYSSLNQLSKSLSESASDLLDIKTTMLDKTHDAEDLLLQLSRTQTELQDGLMNSRMVPFQRLIPRLQRIVRQTANELNKSVELTVINADDEMDRTILERITSPLEHMLRNAVDHGIETPEKRAESGKPATGQIVLEVTREGSEVVIKLRDDGHGINVDAVRKKAISQGLIDENDTSLTDLDVMQYIFNAGLTTTNKVTQISGRGVGMDVVLNQIRQLGGTVSVESAPNRGSEFSMRVPLTVAISDALVVRVADRYYAIPLIQIERVVRVNPDALFDYYQSSAHTFEIDGTDYRLRYLNEMLMGVGLNELAVNTNISLPVIIVKNQTGQNLALQVDEVAGSRIEVVVKPLGRQLSHIAGLSAATIMGDGSVMLILDVLALIRNAPARLVDKAQQAKVEAQVRPKILVVDDSVTVRKVTTRLLERQGFDTYVARDGVDALEILQELTPDLMLLDIEMPRMDGFEVATHVRHDARLSKLPIIMITSRTGDKHRQRAMDIGVTDYMGKPFQEATLMAAIQNAMDVSDDDSTGAHHNES